jgi:hypothetical protein
MRETAMTTSGEPKVLDCGKPRSKARGQNPTGTVEVERPSGGRSVIDGKLASDLRLYVLVRSR